jgi:hypothetical protein
MGLDFIRKIAPSFKKALDRRAVMLRSPGLFTRDIPLVARSASADVCHNSPLKVGEKVILRVSAEKTVVQRDTVIVANFSNPPADFVEHVRAGAGVAHGQVKAVHELSGKVEIEVCE